MKKHLASVRVFVLLIGVVFVGFSLAAEKPLKLLETETYFEMESVGAPQISPDGKFIIFTRGWVDKINDQSRSNVWIADIDGKRIRELTHGNWRDSSPIWSPDGKKIAFLSERDQTTQIHVMWLDTGDVAQLTHIERAPGGLVWSPDGKWLAYTAFVPDEKPILNVKLPKRPEGAKWAAPAVLVDRLAWRSDGRGPLPRGYTHIYVIDAELGGTPRPITSGDYNHNDPHWSADGKTIFFSAIRKPDAEYTWGDSEIYAVDLKTLEVKALTDRKGPDGSPRVSPDGKWIAYSGFEDKNYTSHLSSVSVMDSNGGSKKLLAGNLPSSPGNIIWAADNSGLYYQMEERGEK